MTTMDDDHAKPIVDASTRSSLSVPQPVAGDVEMKTTGKEGEGDGKETEEGKEVTPKQHELEESVICNGRYRTEREINRGSSAVVIRGVDVTSNRPVALKIMDVSERNEVSLPLNSITREVKYAHALSSNENTTDNFARLLNVTNHISPETKREYVVLVWELLEGLDLLDYINSKGGKLTNEEARALFAQLLNAVTTIHDRGFAHRDLKPDNCLVVDANTTKKTEKTLKVIDFGLSKGLNSAKTLGIGTPDYMAPELISRDASGSGGSGGRVGGYDPIKIDIFAMGVTLYLMLIGRYPFEDPTNHSTLATMKNICAGNFARPSKGAIDADALNLIENMLVPEPRRRFSLDDIRNHPWVQVECEPHFEKRLIEAQRMKEARKDREENIVSKNSLGLRSHLVDTKMDCKQEIPEEKKKKRAMLIASLFGGRKK